MLLVCALVAGASMPFAPSLSYDAWGWLLWGREIVGSLPFTTATYPSWKPLTGLIAIPLAPLGDAAPWLWLFGVRTAAVVALLLAFRLGRRAAGPWAGLLAATALLLVPGWLFEAGVGESEPVQPDRRIPPGREHDSRGAGQRREQMLELGDGLG